MGKHVARFYYEAWAKEGQWSVFDRTGDSAEIALCYSEEVARVLIAALEKAHSK